MPTLTHPAHPGASRPSKGRFGFVLREIPIALIAVAFLALLSMRWNPALQSAAAPDKGPFASENAGFSQGQMIAYAPPISTPLRHNQLLTERLIVMTRLEQMQSSAAPLLLASLSDPDPTKRAAAVQVKSREAAPALLKATSDPAADVREAAIWALGELDLPQALPRLQELQVVQFIPFLPIPLKSQRGLERSIY